MNIESGRVVTLAMTVSDATTGKVLQRFSPQEPTAYLHGHDELVATLQSELEGKEAGHHFAFEVDDAYGPAPTGEPAAVPRKEFPREWRITPGMGFYARGSDGAKARLFVHEVRGSRVHVSPSHPWAGRRIAFEGDVLHVRNATVEERDHGHAHGAGGHHH